jgi:response regulator RpfG family c-di-GMP phosphodiesterase
MRPEEFPPQSSRTKSAVVTMHPLRWRQKVLLVGGSESRQSLRASILRAHGLEVHVAESLTEGRAVCQQNAYDWVVLDTHSLFPGEVIEFCEQLRHAVPPQRIAFFVGAPTYISRKWPNEDMAQDKRVKQPGAQPKSAA